MTSQAGPRATPPGVVIRDIFCIGRNYSAHAAELGNKTEDEPVVFLKTASSARGLAAAPTAFASETFHHEAELVLAIGRDLPLGHDVQLDDLAGMTLGLDLTRREKQNELKNKGLPWAAAKSFAGSAVVCSLIPAVDFKTMQTLEFALSVNGEPRQLGRTRDMLFNAKHILNWLAKSHTLRCGDLIFTGTPEGVGPIRVGDTFELRFLGTLSDNVWRGTL